MKNKLLSIFALALLPASMAVPQVAVADPNCIGSECEITFLYTGTQQAFTPPSNASDLRFEVYGAAGGRGGAGGMVAGTITEIPSQLLIYVGGAGGIGTALDGGFNGGGASGGNSDTEGSGGGASDIRIDSTLESRIVVAGGGGGGGGEAGGNGGHGGDLAASHGGSGQASGGGGATQTTGGFAGVSNGGIQDATAGSFGQGGAGGISSFAGGGGGGGGYYGGGGGGADDNTCCSDGGGGGGGSSFADPNFTADVSHQAGVSWGHGWIVLRYSLLPDINYLELIQATNTRIAFSIEGSESLSTLRQEELQVSGEGCYISYFTTDGILGYGSIHGCESGEVTLTVPPGTLGQSNEGPARSVSASTYFDATGPELSLPGDGFASSASEIAIPFELNEGNLSIEDFSFQGCQELDIGDSELILSGCEEGAGSLTLMPMTLIDIWQNRSPQTPITFSFTIDMTGPKATWSEIEVTGEEIFSYSAVLEFQEPVSLSDMAVAFASTSECEDRVTIESTRVLVDASCSYADLSWTITATAFDALGNPTLLSNLTVGASNPAPAAPISPPPAEVIYVPVIVEVPAPVEIVSPEPETPEPQAPALESPATDSPSPKASSASATSSDEVTQSVAVIVSSSPAPTVQLPRPSSQPVENVEVAQLEVIEESEISQNPTAEQTIEEELEPVLPSDQLELAQPVLNEINSPPLEEQPGFPLLPVLMMLGLGILGVGAWRFSGR